MDPSFELSPQQQAHYGDNLAPPYIVGLIVSTAIATIALALRVYAQWLIKNLKAWDNIFAILAFLCLMPLNAMTAWQFSNGAGYHVSRVLVDDPQAPQHLRAVFIAWYWCSIFSAQACLWIKLAMLAFINRVLPCDLPMFRVGWWSVVVLTIMIGIGATIEFTLACLPISYFWERVVQVYGTLVDYPGADGIETGWCMPMNLYLEIPLIASFITDVFLFFLPLIPLWNMQLPFIKKVSVFLTLSLGLFAIGVDVVRVWEIVHFEVLGDVTWLNTPGVAWNAIEYNVALVSACIPALAPLLRRELWKRGTAARYRRQAFWQLGDEPLASPLSNKSDRNLLDVSPSRSYFKNDFRVWGDRSEQWRKPIRRESEGSLWSGDTRSDSRAWPERERVPMDSTSGVVERRVSDITITELMPMECTRTGHKSIRKSTTRMSSS